MTSDIPTPCVPPGTVCRTCNHAPAVGWRWPPSTRWPCCAACLAEHERVRQRGRAFYAALAEREKAERRRIKAASRI